MAERDALLRMIAEDPDDDAPRLVFADWLEETGDLPRAEFVRVQCELASSKLPKAREKALLERERALLDAHRPEWCAAAGVPLEDVTFARGVIASARVSAWYGERMLAPETAPELAAVTELDLARLDLGDAGLAAFAENARLPALRKLILSGNDLTDIGAAALAEATGLPRLGALYLFDNEIGDAGRAALAGSSRFRSTLDLGEPEEGYAMTPGQADVARRVYLRERMLPKVRQHFTTHEKLRSAMLCVAQYWADEADDAVHGVLIVSELPEPVLEGIPSYAEGPYEDPNLPNTFIKQDYGEASSSARYVGWDSNGRAIPLWAAFAPEDGSQEYEYYSEVYSPAVRFYRHGGYEILPMQRPYLDGVRPESDR